MRMQLREGEVEKQKRRANLTPEEKKTRRRHLRLLTGKISSWPGVKTTSKVYRVVRQNEIARIKLYGGRKSNVARVK